jgi:acetylornithine/succinyldiaminopimelate/putrescine aminotransferase
VKNDELRQRYRRYGPMGPDAPEPVFAGKGVDAWLEDAAGGKLLDFASGGSAPLGHNHPDIDRALNQVGHAPGMDGVVTPDEVALMHKLAELVPGGMNRRVLVCESGREALARAIELARTETNRSCVSYLSNSPDDKPKIGKDVAAVVAHPLDGRIKHVRRACDAAGALLIDDEAGIGPGATGRMLAVELATEFLPPRHKDTKSQSRPETSAGGVRPDIYVLGRGWAAGFPFGACVTRSSTLRWKCATAGNPIGCALALETIRLLEAGLLEQSRKLAAYLEKRFGALSSPKLEPELWGVGLVRTIVLRKGKDVAEGLVQKCRELGLLLQTLTADTVAVRPSLVASEKDVDFATEVVGKVLAGFDKKA